MNSLYGPIPVEQNNEEVADAQKVEEEEDKKTLYVLTYDFYDTKVEYFEADEIDAIIAKVKEVLRDGYRISKIVKKK